MVGFKKMSVNLEYGDGLIYYEGTNKLAEGHFQSFSEEGQLYCEYTLKEGKYDGYIITYWANGRVAHKGFFEKGICNSEILFYYPTGQIQAVDQMKNNVRHGISKQYSEDGALVELIRFIDGKRVS